MALADKKQHSFGALNVNILILFYLILLGEIE